MMLERICNSIKSYTKKSLVTRVLVTGALFGSIFATAGYSNDAARNRGVTLNSTEASIGYIVPSEIDKLREFSDPNKNEAYSRRAILNPSEVHIAAPTIASEIDKLSELFNDVDKLRKPSLDANDVKEPFFTPEEMEEINKILFDEDAIENPLLITTVYGEAGYYNYNSTVNENPMLLNVMTIYNIFDKSPDEGALLLMGRVLAKGDKSENFWNNYLDIGGGIAYQLDSIIIGAEGGRRESLRRGDNKSFKEEGDFLRLWGGYWNMWQLKELEATETFLDRVWGTNNFQFDYNTLEKNLVADFRADINLDSLNLWGFIIGPFAKGKINYDEKNEIWNRFGEVGGGIRIRNGPFSIFFESGYRESFNDKGRPEGSYNAVYGGFWFPIVY